MLDLIPVILPWWVAWLFLGLIAWPISRFLFSSWEDQGYLFAKIIGPISISFGVLILGLLRVLPFGWISILLSGLAVLGGGWQIKRKLKPAPLSWKLVIAEELMFLVLLIGWTFVKAHEPNIQGLEKFMDYGFSKSILRTQYFPPVDMWFSGEPINYYYFGHLLMSLVTKVSGVGLNFGFNLMLSSLFALCFSLSFVILRHLLSGEKVGVKILGALFGAYLVTLAGNLHPIYAFTKGYSGEEPPPFWSIFINPLNKDQLETAWNTYWYPNATRFIPYSIHEFPSYSFVVSDIHGHVLSIPFALLAIGLLVSRHWNGHDEKRKNQTNSLAFGVVCGVMFMTNALDGPIYMGLYLILEWMRLNKSVTKLTLAVWPAVVFFVLTAMPFLISFKPFVSGIALNCPPDFLSAKTGEFPPGVADDGRPYRKIGPLIFESSDKCQRSPLWMLVVLWGFFGFATLGLFVSPNQTKSTANISMLRLVCWFSLALILFSEVFYFKDIYPLHFRSNTMFKLGYQAFILLSIVSAYSIVKSITTKYKNKILYLAGLAPLIFLVGIYPYFSVKSYFGSLNNYRGLDGTAWIKDDLPDDWAVIDYLNKNIPGNKQPVILEANGDSYTDYERISTFTGLPTVAGWTVHEWLWRGGYGPIAERALEVAKVYEAGEGVWDILNKYKVEYIIIGEMERKKYPNLDENFIASFSTLIFERGSTRLYQVNQL